MYNEKDFAALETISHSNWVWHFKQKSFVYRFFCGKFNPNTEGYSKDEMPWVKVKKLSADIGVNIN